jgi:SAM-dependent methyltransferase
VDRNSSFVDLQKSYWSDLDVAHFRWQTSGPYIAPTEASLVAATAVTAKDRFLEIGCGEGSNLFHLRELVGAARLHGVDFSFPKVRFAAQATSARTVNADAASLPYRTACFDSVLIRDLLHHVPDRERAIEEALRVLRPGGRITIIEPNGRNPLIATMALGIRAELGMLRSTPARVVGELQAAGACDIVAEARQPMPISRLVLHYRFGLPRLGSNASFTRLLQAVESSARRLPRSLWAYFVVRATWPGSRTL